MEQVLADQTACLHCGTLFSTSKTTRFCCVGCEFVFDLIKSNGLNHFYQLKDQNPPVCPLPVQSSSFSYAYCDDPAFLKSLGTDGTKLRFYVEGLNCTACLWLLEKLPDYCADAESARIDMSSSTIEVRRKPGGSFAEIARTLNRFGYRPHPLSENDSATALQATERRQDLVRIGIAGALTGNIMILAVSLYAGASGELAKQFHWLSAVLALPILTYCAWPFYRSALGSLKAKHLNIDVPIVAAIIAGIFMSVWSLVAAKERVYFDSLSMLVFLLLSSRLILKSVQNDQLRSTRLEDELLLASVKRIGRDNSIENVSSLSLAVGDNILIDIDQSVPVDGSIVFGEGTISAAVLTGESQPVKVRAGDSVEAGSRKLSGSWILKVKNLPRETRLAQILRDTESAANGKSDFVRASDRVANWFVGLVFFGAAAVVIYFFNTNLEEGISRALALLIVTCPCVFGIAIPLSMSIAIRSAAKIGVVVKNSDSIERLWSARTLLLDKTGTLTTGAMEVTDFWGAESSDLPFALGLERDQQHPVARALVRYLNDLRIQPKNFESVLPIPTGGVSGLRDGHRYSLAPLSSDKSESNVGVLLSEVGLFRDQNLIAKFVLGDRLRQDSQDLIAWARRKKLGLALVSGDRDRVVKSCASQIGLSPVETHSETSPEQKAHLVRSFGHGSVMIGDGVNDAMALATANVGIAVCGSLEVSLRAADVYLVRQRLSLIPRLFEIARQTKSAIFRNLIFSAGFNLVSGTLAILGFMTPLWAAVLMPLSSVTILLSAIWTGNNIEKAGVRI